jgi:hypothetical protein
MFGIVSILAVVCAVVSGIPTSGGDASSIHIPCATQATVPNMVCHDWLNPTDGKTYSIFVNNASFVHATSPITSPSKSTLGKRIYFKHSDHSELLCDRIEWKDISPTPATAYDCLALQQYHQNTWGYYIYDTNDEKNTWTVAATGGDCGFGLHAWDVIDVEMDIGNSDVATLISQVLNQGKTAGAGNFYCPGINKDNGWSSWFGMFVVAQKDDFNNL